MKIFKNILVGLEAAILVLMVICTICAVSCTVLFFYNVIKVMIQAL